MLLVHSKNLLLVGNIINYTEFLLPTIQNFYSPPPPPYFSTKMRPKGPKKIFSPYLKVWIHH